MQIYKLHFLTTRMQMKIKINLAVASSYAAFFCQNTGSCGITLSNLINVSKRQKSLADTLFGTDVIIL